MSIQPIDILISSTLEPSSGRRGRLGGQSFDETYNKIVGQDFGKSDGVQPSEKAEILRLAMLRNSLLLADGPASEAYTTSSSKSLLSAYNESFLCKSEEVGARGEAQPLQKACVSSVQRATGDINPHTSDIINRASQKYGVDESLIKAVIKAESNFKPTAVSSAGAQGLMQLMPATAAQLGVKDPFQPEQNVMAGTRFLRDLLQRYDGNIDKVLAAYNWGPGNVDKGTRALPKETREYLIKVKKYMAEYSVA